MKWFKKDQNLTKTGEDIDKELDKIINILDAKVENCQKCPKLEVCNSLYDKKRETVCDLICIIRDKFKDE